MRRLIPMVFLLVAIVGGGLALWRYRSSGTGTDPPEVTVSGTIEVTALELAFKIPGRVEKRLVDEGQRIEAQQLVAQLECADLEQEVALRRAEVARAEALVDQMKSSRKEDIEAARAAMEKAKAALEDLEQGAREQEIRAAEAAQAQARAEANRYKANLQRAEQLRSRRVISPEEYDAAKAAYEVATQRLRAATEQLELLLAGPRPKQVEQARKALEEASWKYQRTVKGPREEKRRQARASLEAAQAALRLAETKLGYTKIVSPIRGMVLSKNVEPGEYVAAGTPVVTVADLDHPYLRAYIGERDLGRVKPGQQVVVTTDTYPDKQYPGRISFISSEAEFTPKTIQTHRERVKLVYRIKITLDNPQWELLPGMPADAKILIHQGASASQWKSSAQTNSASNSPQ